jgi:hypothetical protein
MRWPWKRPPRDTAGIERSKALLAQARADEPRVASVVEAHEKKIRENHFGVKIHQALGAPPR